MPNRIPLSKISIAETSPVAALNTIAEFLSSDGGPSHICVLNVRMAMQANEELPELIPYYNDSFLTVPDGMPLVWYGRYLGYEKVARTCGPELLVDLLEISDEKNYSHYFIGSTPETLTVMQEAIARRFPDAGVLGVESPAHRKVLVL